MRRRQFAWNFHRSRKAIDGRPSRKAKSFYFSRIERKNVKACQWILAQLSLGIIETSKQTSKWNWRAQAFVVQIVVLINETNIIHLDQAHMRAISFSSSRLWPSRSFILVCIFKWKFMISNNADSVRCRNLVLFQCICRISLMASQNNRRVRSMMRLSVRFHRTQSFE